MDYTDKTIKYFRQPKNFGPLKDPDGVGQVGNLVCGDVIKIYVKIKENRKKELIVSDISFETFGCVAAVATSAALTEMAKGLPVRDALKIEANDIIEFLGGMPQIKVHCSVLAQDALAEALYMYYLKSNNNLPINLARRHQLILEREKHLPKEN